MSFPQFGEVIQEDSPQFSEAIQEAFPQFGEVIQEEEIITPQKPTLAEKIAPQFKAYGWQPKPETVQKVLHPTAVGMKGFTKGTFGTPGDIINFLQNTIGIEKPMTILPTSETVGDIFDKLTGEKFEPENLAEDVAERGFEFLGSMFGLGGMAKASTPLKALGKNMLRAFVPGGVSVAGEKLNLPPWMQVASTLGTSFLTHRLTGKGLHKVKNALYDQSKQIAGEETVSASKLDKNLLNLKKTISSGGSAPSDAEALKKIKEIRAGIQDGKIGVNKLSDYRRKVNEIKGGLFEKDLGKAGVRTARRNMNSVSKELDGAVKLFDNPEFQEIYKDANSLHGGLAETESVAKWLKGNIKNLGITGGILKYLAPSVFSSAKYALPAAQAYKFVKALATKPGYRKAYWDVLKSASKESLKGTAADVKKFNKESEKILEED